MKNESITRVKLYKKGKFWLASTIVLAGIGYTNTAMASEVQNSPVNINVSQQVNQSNDSQTDQQMSNNSSSDIQTHTSQSTNATTEVTADQVKKQTDVVQDDKNRLHNDTQTANKLKPNTADQVDKINKKIDDVNTQINNTNKSVIKNQNNIQEKKSQIDTTRNTNNQLNQKINDQQKVLNDQNNKLNQTSKNITTYQPATPAKPGNYGNHLSPYTGDAGTHINSVSDLPNKLVDPKDGHTNDDGYYIDYSWYSYIGKNDKTEKINLNKLTDKQLSELSQYALTLINDFRQQHHLPPFIASDNTQKMAKGDVALREKNNIKFDDTSWDGHSNVGQNISESDWNKYTVGAVTPKYDKSGYKNNDDLVFLQNAGFLQGDEMTMLHAKVQILEALTAMAYDDGLEGNLHTQAMLVSNDPNNIYSVNASRYFFGLGVQPNGNSNGNAAIIFDIWAEKNDEEALKENNGHSQFSNLLNKDAYEEYQLPTKKIVKSNPEYVALSKQVASSKKVLIDYQNEFKNNSKQLKKYTESLKKNKKQLSIDNKRLSLLKDQLLSLQDEANNLKNQNEKQMENYTEALNRVNDDKKLLEHDEKILAHLKQELAQEQGHSTNGNDSTENSGDTNNSNNSTSDDGGLNNQKNDSKDANKNITDNNMNKHNNNSNINGYGSDGTKQSNNNSNSSTNTDTVLDGKNNRVNISSYNSQKGYINHIESQNRQKNSSLKGQELSYTPDHETNVSLNQTTKNKIDLKSNLETSKKQFSKNQKGITLPQTDDNKNESIIASIIGLFGLLIGGISVHLKRKGF